MFFAAFEKKWWKLSDSKSDEGVKQDHSTAENLQGSAHADFAEIEEAARHTALQDWQAGEKIIEHADEITDADERGREDEIDDEDEEVFTNSDNYEQVDPHAPPAFDLDDKDDAFGDDYEDVKSHKRKPRISSVKEFFNTEILYRYDIMEDADRDELKGDYSIEITGEDASVWTISLSRDITIKNEKNNTPVTLRVDSNDFLSIVNGKLNCQIALVSRRVRIEGDTKKASLLQNILAPRPE